MVKVFTYNKHASTFIIAVGISCMIVAGYFLIEGLSQFSGDATTRNILIVGGILFQIAESLCFVAAAALTFHSRLWRVSLFGLGCVLFLFSVGVMTLAQKTALQTGINEAGAIDEKRAHMREQLSSLDKMIESYQYNAEKQSKSIFKDSRALGQDSINRATEIEQQKLEIADQLFALSQQRKETSVDFFNRLEDVTSLPARNTEFYFLVLRSLLIELCGILLMAFGANLRAYAVRSRPVPIKDIIAAKVAAHAANNSSFEQNKTIVADVNGDTVRAEASKTKHVVKTKGKKDAADGTQVKQVPKASNTSKTKTSKPQADNKTLSRQAQAEHRNRSPLSTENVDEVFDIDNVDLDAEIQYIEDHPRVRKYTEHSYSQHIQRLRDSSPNTLQSGVVATKNDQGNSIIDLYQKGVISSLNREEIINGLRKYNNLDVDKALDIQIKNFVSPDSETVKS